LSREPAHHPSQHLELRVPLLDLEVLVLDRRQRDAERGHRLVVERLGDDAVGVLAADELVHVPHAVAAHVPVPVLDALLTKELGVDRGERRALTHAATAGHLGVALDEEH
jgi:hypothetical protein